MGDQGEATSNRFGVLLRQLREARGLTQQKLACASGISVRAIQDLESGRTRNPQFHTTAELAKAMRVTASEREALNAAARPPLATELEAGAAEVEPADHRATDEAIAPAETELRIKAVGVRRTVTVVGAVIIVVLSGLGLRAATSASAGPPTQSSLATITSPRAGASVPGDDLEVHGTASLPTGTELWLLVHPEHGDPGYWAATPKPITIDASGGWAARITIGRGSQDDGYSFRLIAVISPVDGGVERHVKLLPKGKHYPHMNSIPTDCLQPAQIQVTRAR